MKDNQFCFIICTNDEVKLEECLQYIDLLNVPQGYEIDVLTIHDATSMTSAYNAAMKSSAAKYKVYIHQDVLIINRNLIFDLLKIFEHDEEIHMIGLVGYKDVNKCGIMWEEKRYGTVPLYGVGKKYSDINPREYAYQISDGVEEVSMIDGFFMVTNVDVEWDEEFDSFDLYDASQCMRFTKSGKKIVVPVQKYPWAIHDDGRYLSLWRYNKYRHLFINKYLSS